MRTTVGRTALEIVSGDITELAVDAVASAAATDLRMATGVAAALKRVGGETVEREAVAQGPIAIGEAVATAGHDLKAPWVIHAAVMGPDLQADAHAIARATASALAMADKVGARSLALPAFGAGDRGLPPLPVRQHHGGRDGALPDGDADDASAPRDLLGLQ